jgi:hypothetical protein
VTSTDHDLRRGTKDLALRGQVGREPENIAAEHLVALVLFAVVVTLGALRSFLADPANHDFGSFYQSGKGALNDESLYPPAAVGRVNLNSPVVNMLAFAPLARLPLTTAAVLWCVAGLVLLTASLRVIALELEVSGRQLALLTSALLAAPASMFVWAEGQVTWFLLLPASLSWRAYRRRDPLQAGLWLGPLVVAKPFLALLAVGLGRKAAAGATGAVLVLSIFGVLLSGWAPWIQWLSLAREVSWLGEPANASVMGILARLKVSEEIALGVGMLAALAAAAIPWCVPRSDARWLIACLGAIMASPLGWVYYLPLAAGPAFACWGSRSPRALWLFYVPLTFVGVVGASAWLAAVVGSAYGFGLLAVWLGLLVDGQRQTDS